MKLLKRLKGLFAAILMVVIVFTNVVPTYANTSREIQKGDSDYITDEISLEEQFEELFLESSSEQERQIILNKAYQMGINIDIDEVSKEDINIAQNSINVNSSIRSNRRIITNNSNTGIRTQAYATVAGVSMPDYALWPTIYKQEKSDWCSAATVYTVAKYIGANPPAQKTIMNFWKSQWNVTYPDLPLIRNYMNNHLPGKSNDYVPYVYKNYANSQTTFNKDLKNNVLNYQPMILNMKNSSGTTNWPYKTNGHFCMCNGLLTWESNKYFIGDPFYFTAYVPGATKNNGEHKKTWTQLNQVIKNRFGSTSQYYLT